jgi:ActR/RegA family two-component response regulator
MSVRSVIIVEDEAVVAIDMAMAFSEAGWTVIGPFGRLEEARKAARSTLPSAAVVDLNLYGQSSVSVAEELAKKDVRLVLFTGGETKGLPAFLADAAIVSKPADVREVVSKCAHQRVATIE